MTLPHRIKRTLRPLIPDRVMARYRLQQHSLQVRTNVDVVLDPARARRWLAVTPDTYRVRAPAAASVPYERVSIPVVTDPDASVLAVAGADVSEAEVAAAAGLLSDGDLGAGIVAEVAPPRLAGRRRVEPPLAPVAIAVPRNVWQEVGGPPPGPDPLPGFLARLRDAGHRLGVIPRPPAGAETRRTDPITDPPVVILRRSRSTTSAAAAGAPRWAWSCFAAATTSRLSPSTAPPSPSISDSASSTPSSSNTASTSSTLIGSIARAGRPGIAIVAVPAEPFLAPARRLAGADWSVVYDVIDDWSDPALGGEWYRADVEEAFIAAADGLSASAPDLVARIAALGGSARLVPNGVDAVTFGVGATERPDDLPVGYGPVIGYHGSLYGPWFDWEALVAVAAAYPEATVVIIGDDKAGHPDMPANVSFLGLKPRQTLPGYVQRFDVGLVPFRVTDMTHAVSPLKAFEYLASGVPVAAIAAASARRPRRGVRRRRSANGSGRCAGRAADRSGRGARGPLMGRPTQRPLRHHRRGTRVGGPSWRGHRAASRRPTTHGANVAVRGPHDQPQQRQAQPHEQVDAEGESKLLGRAGGGRRSAPGRR